jgi:hypothetical protein
VILLLFQISEENLLKCLKIGRRLMKNEMLFDGYELRNEMILLNLLKLIISKKA